MTKKMLIDYLNSIYPLSPGLLRHLMEILKQKKLKKKEFLLTEGSICKEVSFISHGLIRAFYLDYDAEVSSWFMKEEDTIFSVRSFYKQVPSHENLQCLEDTELFYISYDELQAIYKNFMEFNFIRAKLTEDYYLKSEDRAHCMRMKSAYERYSFVQSNEPEIFYRVPGKYLSSYLGISEFTLSRIKNGYKN